MPSLLTDNQSDCILNPAVTRPRTIGVLSSSHPEMDRLAGELCRRDALDIFVRRYVNKGRAWENLLQTAPGVRQRIAGTLGRRPLSPGLTIDKVTDAGVVYDFLSAMLLRSRLGIISSRGAYLMSRASSRAIASKGAKLLADVDTVVGNYSVSARAFQQVKSRGGRAVLNYPNVHHRFLRKLLLEEAECEPEFASTIPDRVKYRTPVLDRECELADSILVGSTFVRKSFIAEGLGAKDIAVIPYGCETSQFVPRHEPTSDGTFRALFVGLLTQRKGLSYLLRGYQLFRGVGTELIIAGGLVGNAAALDPYRSLFTYLGNVSHAELKEVYQKADVFVFPSLLEGMGLVVLEAMASGLPVITTDNGPGDIVRDGVDGFIVPIRDPQAIAERLEFLRANPDVRLAMGRSARVRALEFTWNAYCQRAAAVVLGAD